MLNAEEYTTHITPVVLKMFEQQVGNLVTFVFVQDMALIGPSIIPLAIGGGTSL
jgi:hypothetical protein